MRNRSGEKIKLSGIDELLGVVNEESAMEIDIASIHPFAGHPFKVIDLLMKPEDGKVLFSLAFPENKPNHKTGKKTKKRS